MLREIVLCISLLLSVQYCTYSEKDNSWVEIDPSELSYRNTGLPVLELNTPQPVNSKEVWVENADMTLYDSDGKLISEHKFSIRGRGNSTWLQDKKPYALKFDKKASLWGRPKHKRWVLLANAYDRSMMRYDIAFHIAR